MRNGPLVNIKLNLENGYTILIWIKINEGNDSNFVEIIGTSMKIKWSIIEDELILNPNVKFKIKLNQWQFIAITYTKTNCTVLYSINSSIIILPFPRFII